MDRDRPNGWQRFCDLCRTEQDDLYAHQLVCPDALAYALDPASLLLREYWAVVGEGWTRGVLRVLGRPLTQGRGEGADAGRWYTHWSDGTLMGPAVQGAKVPKGKDQDLVLGDWLDRVGYAVFSTPEHARAVCVYDLEREIGQLRKQIEVVRAGEVRSRRYRKRDEALVVHRLAEARVSAL
jgi:hypothetical protein